MGNVRKKVVILSETDDFSDRLQKQKFETSFFDAYKFDENNEISILEMWQRVIGLCKMFKPNLIIVRLREDSMINDNERSSLEEYAPVLMCK